nr:restriction endonuclease subunit S [Pseudacidovorax intermedius]
MGPVPSAWAVMRLMQVASVNDDVLSETTDAETEIEYVDIGSVSLDRGIERTERINFGKAPSRARRQVQDGDVLVSTVRTYLKAIAPVVAPPANLVVSTGFAVVRPTFGLLSGYAKYVLQSSGFVDEVISRSTGVSYPAINASELVRICVPVPPTREQAAIAGFLDRETAKIDALIAEQEKLIILLAEKRQATISHAVIRGLDPNARMKDSGVVWLGEVPAHWRVMRVKDVARLESGHTPSKQHPEYWENCDIPWVSLNDSKFLAANDYIAETAVMINELGLANSSARMLPPGAVVFTRDATIGLAAITERPMAVSQHLIAWCPSEKLTSLFLLRVFNAMRAHLDAHTFGATIKTIGMADVKKLVTPVPPPEEQKAITQFIDAELAKMDVITADTKRALSLLKERRATLIAAAVTGQIDVRGTIQDTGA